MIIKNNYKIQIKIDDFYENQKPLCSISFVGSKEKCAYPNLMEIIYSCSELLVPLLETISSLTQELKLYLYVGLSCNEPLSRIGQYKKIWKTDLIPVALRKDEKCILGPEVELHNGYNVFGYAGLIEFPINKLSVALETVRMNNHCAIFISDDKNFFSEKNIKTIYSHREFSEQNNVPETTIDWVKLCIKCCNDCTIAIRATGNFDDSSASVDIIGIEKAIIYNEILDRIIQKYG